MNGISNRFFLDTNTVVNILRGHSIHQVVDNKILRTSFIVELECLSKSDLSQAEIALIQEFFNEETIVHE